MKRIVIPFVALVFLCLLFSGCDLDGSKDYYYDFFVISIANYNLVSEPAEPYTFDSIKQYRDDLKAYKKSSDLNGSGADATRSDVFGLLRDGGYSSSEANDLIAGINSLGNGLIVFELKNNYIDYLIAYFEKL